MFETTQPAKHWMFDFSPLVWPMFETTNQIYYIYIYYNSQITTEKKSGWFLPSSPPLPFPRYISGRWLSPTPLKNMLVSWDDDIPNLWKIKFHGSKLPTRHIVPFVSQSHVKPSSTQHSPRFLVHPAATSPPFRPFRRPSRRGPRWNGHIATPRPTWSRGPQKFWEEPTEVTGRITKRSRYNLDKMTCGICGNPWSRTSLCRFGFVLDSCLGFQFITLS